VTRRVDFFLGGASESSDAGGGARACAAARAREGVTSFAGRYNTETSLCNRGVDFARETRLAFGGMWLH
jgi:hypothetical protein